MFDSGSVAARGRAGEWLPRDRVPSEVPVRACAAGLQQHSAGVEPESGHVRADLVFGGDGFGAGAVVRLAEEEGAGEQWAAREPGGFFFLFGVAGDEGVAGDLLDFPDVVVKQDLGEFVADVAVGASRVVARVVQGDGPAVGQVEGGGGERAGLEPLQFFEAGAVDEMVCRDDCDVQVLGDLPDVEHVVRAQPQLGPGKFGEPVSFGFESSSHGCYLPAGPYPRVVSLCCMSWSRSPGNREASGLKVGVARSRIRTDSGGGRGWCTARGPGRRCGGRPRR